MDDKAQIIEVIENYARSLEQGDPELWEGLFWLDDPEFSVIENDRAGVMGREYTDLITALIRDRGAQPGNQVWSDTSVHVLTAEIAYTVSRRLEINTDKTSRVTLVMKKKGDQWRIVHCHFSFTP